ncbi:type II toxin-antitoxin system RelE/ParE family toxin [Bordetella ansorpii]|jgi:toxin ParE1/3/4|uniref:type II toxin-antitoxin system RelE/ParE family toxin n=1 Tax=Bordetella ansorpii TaxID=288768 RepID=UPI0009EF36D1|nr:type II toxin-antitoxin system RelE/ParE family toxin [Bordetella ansorpii]
MQLLWALPARDDRREIRDYIARDSVDAALALDALFSEQAVRLISHPHLGRTGRVAGTREFVVHRNYILVYDVVGDIIRLLRILHAARQWPSGR